MKGAIASAIIGAAAVAACCVVPVVPAFPQSLRAASGAASQSGQTPFPGVGHTYRVDFVGANGDKFTVQLVFTSETSMTYTGISPDGACGDRETVKTEVTPIASGIFMVTWQEADKTTVVHVEDYNNMIFYTNITDGGNAHSFSKYKGTATLIK